MFDQVENEINALLPGKASENGPSRRTALKTALGLGYAASTLPTLAQTAISTSAQGLNVGEGVLQVQGASVPYYYAAPQGKKNLPTILVVHEIFGVHAYIADICRRFAQAGYLAIAPDLFARQGNASQYTDMAQLMQAIVYKVPDAQVMGDLDAAAAAAVQHGGNPQRLGVTGFCWGGRITWLYAAHNPKVKAGVAWYGRLVGEASNLTPRHPLALAAELKAPVLGLYAGQDAGIALTTVNQMKDALAAAKTNPAAQASEFTVYPHAPHAFHADYRPSYRESDAKDGFQHALRWFKTKV
jgi:carboxymethylenebutenolidase